MIGIDQFVDRLLEISGEGAANAAGIQFRYGDPGVLHEAAVNTDFAVFIFQQDHFFFGDGTAQQFFNQRGFACAEKTGNNVYLYHFLFTPLRFRTFQGTFCRNYYYNRYVKGQAE